MFVGPVFSRELAIAPRRTKFYVARTVYPLALLVLIGTAWMVLSGTQIVRDIGDFARFATVVFQILAPLQLALAVFFSALLAASEVAHEKDRRTLILLLLTNLSNSELVLGKLLASILPIFVAMVAAAPIFMLLTLLGGVSFEQIALTQAVTFLTALCCGSLGSMLALWREKTFQAVALTILVLVLWLVFGQMIASGMLGANWAGLSCRVWAAALSPWLAILEATRPYMRAEPALGVFETPVHLFLLTAIAFTALWNGLAIALVRVWNPSRASEERKTAFEGSADVLAKQSADVAASRHVWDNPIIWREIRTWAYGRKILVVRLVYLALFAISACGIYWTIEHGRTFTSMQGALALAPIFLLSFVLVNAQAVTSLTSERDVGALDLLLVTDLSPKEIVYGKLGGIFYNTKEMLVLPMCLCVGLWCASLLSFENLLYLFGGLAVLYVFVAMVGLHAGMTYANSGAAVATSLGTIFFLFVGIAVCMYIMLTFSGSFQAQFLPFFASMVFGGVGLYVVLGVRNPSPAIGIASFVCPFATFYAITSFLLDSPLAVFLVTVTAYSFTTASMLVPAICEFDIATGRTTADE